MRNKFIMAGLMAAVTLPTLAQAPAAMAQPDPACVRSNQGSTATGAVLGALGGALIGNAIGGRHSRGTDTALGAVAGGVTGGAIANGRNDPCPDGYYRPDPGPGYGPPPGPGYGPPPGGGGFWAGAPQRIYDRINFLQNRINRGASSGRISPPDARYANHDLNDIRRQEADMRYRDGGHLSPPDRDYLQSRLDNLSQRLHWDARWGY